MELGKLKGLLGISGEDSSRDTSLEFVMEDVKETILNYCNLEELPAGLQSTTYRMAVDLFRGEKPGDENAAVRVTSITTGDTATTFANAADALKGGVLKNYQTQLNRYRKLR
jgi:hypothetical protein